MCASKNNWKILEQWAEKHCSTKRNKIYIYYKVKVECPKCHTILVRNRNGLRTNKSCMSCHRKQHTPFGYVPTRYFNTIKNRAKYDNKVFTVTLKYVDNLFSKQNGKCAYSGRPLYFAKNPYNKADRQKQNASLDRINSSKGYVQGNVQWIHKDINKSKLAMSHKEFLNMCREIADWCRA